jgi:hypothetical protein
VGISLRNPWEREIEYIATFIMDFFRHSYFLHPQDEITITPDNTTFIEYIPYSALNNITDITATPSEHGSVLSTVRFLWEEEANVARPFRNYKASNPRWQDTSVSAVNEMIRCL